MGRIGGVLREIGDWITRGAAAPEIVRTVTAEGLSYLGRVALQELLAQVERIEAAGIPGSFLEAGCARGGSAIVIASAKRKARPFTIYDVFGMIPPPSEKDGQDVHARYEAILSGKAAGRGGRPYYGYQSDLYEEVLANFARYRLPTEQNNIRLCKGLFQETLHPDAPVALAHIDGDWYESVKVCLERIAPWLSLGGVLVIDDYYHWSGCRMAVDEYLADKSADFRIVHGSRLHILRK